MRPAGPQVPDPRGPAFAPYLSGHLKWWDAIYALAGSRGDSTVSTTPEFGPPSYAWIHPFTSEPLVNVWDVNHFVAGQVATLFEARFGSDAAAKVIEDEDRVR